MSMRDASNARTVCEVLREINDLVQGRNSNDKAIRKLLSEAETMAKKMSYKLLEYNQEVFKDCWQENPDKLKKLKLRNSKFYLTGEYEKQGRIISKDEYSLFRKIVRERP
jgi:hypothetical protein